jgi:hypothetical protein
MPATHRHDAGGIPAGGCGSGNGQGQLRTARADCPLPISEGKRTAAGISIFNRRLLFLQQWAMGNVPLLFPAPPYIWRSRGQVAQLVEHVTENHGVGSSILPLAI